MLAAITPMVLCGKCGQRPATIHVVIVVDGKSSKSDYCVACSPIPVPDYTDEQLDTFATKSFALPFSFSALTADERESLLFVRECLAQAKNAMGASGHVTGQQLLAAAPAAAQKIYGADAREQLRRIGITSSAAVGAIVFRFVESGIFSKTSSDRIEDFTGPSVFDAFLGVSG